MIRFNENRNFKCSNSSTTFLYFNLKKRLAKNKQMMNNTNVTDDVRPLIANAKMSVKNPHNTNSVATPALLSSSRSPNTTNIHLII